MNAAAAAFLAFLGSQTIPMHYRVAIYKSQRSAFTETIFLTSPYPGWSP